MIFTAGSCDVGDNGTAYETLVSNHKFERIPAPNVIIIILCLFNSMLMIYAFIIYRLYVHDLRRPDCVYIIVCKILTVYLPSSRHTALTWVLVVPNRGPNSISSKLAIERTIFILITIDTNKP